MCSLGISYVPWAIFSLMAVLPQPPQCWHYGYATIRSSFLCDFSERKCKIAHSCKFAEKMLPLESDKSHLTATLAPLISEPPVKVSHPFKKQAQHCWQADPGPASLSEDSSPAGSGGILAPWEFLEEPDTRD